MTRYAPIFLILLLVIAFRVFGSAFPESLPNFQPISALFFCGALLATGWRQWAIPLGVWLVTYPIPAFLEGNYAYLQPGTLLTTAFALGTMYYFGKKISQKSTLRILSGSIVAAILFHSITNGLAWMASPLYVKNLQGLWQSLWLGPETSVIPSWVFLRNMAAANLLFTLIFVSARMTLPKISSRNLSLAAR